MNSSNLYEIVTEALRALVLIGAPVFLASSLGGLVMGVFQSATTIREPVLGYAARVLAVGAVLYLMLPGFIATITRLSEIGWR
jgi:flagellar biosynthesis protein FliQ